MRFFYDCEFIEDGVNGRLVERNAESIAAALQSLSVIEFAKAQPYVDPKQGLVAGQSFGGTIAIEPDGTFTQTVAFTTESAAREGESKEMPDDVRAWVVETVGSPVAAYEEQTGGMSPGCATRPSSKPSPPQPPR